MYKVPSPERKFSTGTCLKKLLKLVSLQRRGERYSIIYVQKILNNFAPNDIYLEFKVHLRQEIKAKILPMINGAWFLVRKENTFTAAQLFNVLPSPKDHNS